MLKGFAVELFKCFLVGLVVVAAFAALYYAGCGVQFLLQHSWLIRQIIGFGFVGGVITIFGAVCRYSWLSTEYVPTEVKKLEAPTQDIPTILTPIEEKVSA